MSRHQFGQSPSDWTFTVGAANAATLAGGVTITLWDLPSGGTQLTDLLDATGTPITSVTSSGGLSGLPIGTIPLFYGPDTVTEMWADAGGGYRSRITAHDAYAPSDDARFGQVAGVAVSGPPAAGLALRATSGSASVWTADGTSDWPNVRSPAYAGGAKGDGVTDDTAAITAAVAAAPAGGTVYLPAGTYLLNGSSGLTLAASAVTLRGAGAEATRIIIGAGFTGSSAVTVTGANAQIMDLSINGASSTTTSNPAAHGITCSGARRLKVDSCQFWYLNGYAVRALATSAGSTSNPHGTQLSRLRVNQCAGGLHFLGHTAQGYAVNSFVTDVHIQQGGTGTGASANLDGLRIEDAWDVLVENVITWLQAGTGSSLHITGNCAASFIRNLDALGPNGLAPNVLIEDGANGSPQNVQISGGVIQQGTVGVKISGGAQHVHVDSIRVINNTGHGAQIDGTGVGIYLHKVFFSQSGQGATGTNYDVNWSGTATGHILNCRFSSPIVATGTAGVQQTVNVTSGQGVRVLNADFQGAGAASTNWFTAFPMVVTRLDGSAMEHIGSLDFRLPTNTRVSLRPVAAGNNALAINVNGADTVDRFRLLGDGSQQYGTGVATRDTTWGRQGAAQIGTPDSDVIIGLAGKGLRVKEGSNARMGTATLTAGTVTVSNTSVTTNTRIFVGAVTPGGTPGAHFVNAVTVGTSFVIKSTSSTDTSVVAYLLVEAA